MLNSFLHSELLKSNRIIGLHVKVQGSEEPLFSYVILKRKKGKIEIELEETIQCDFEKLPSHLPIKCPIYLSIDGKGILHKKIQRDSSKPAIQEAIPNAKEEDFYFEQFDSTEQTAYLSFARKEAVNEILTKLQAQKFSVVGLTISPFVARGIFEIFPDLPSSLLVGSYVIEVEKTDGAIAGYRKLDDDTIEPKSYTLGDNHILSSHLLPFYQALTYYANGSEASQYPAIAAQKTEYVSKRLFILAGGGTLLFLFLVLLINLFVFTSLTEEKQRLESQVLGNREIVSKLKQVKGELAWKEKFIGQGGGDQKKWFSYVADQIGSTVPEEITLEKLELHPVTSKIRKQKEIEIAPDAIRIEGIAKSSLPVNDWALELKKMPWATSVAVENFSLLENSQLGIFSIEIRLIPTIQ